MKSLVAFINEGKNAIEDMINLLSSFTTAVEDGEKVPEVSKKDVIVTGKLCSNLIQVNKLSHGMHYLYTEFSDDKLSKVAIIDIRDKEADIWDNKFRGIYGKEFEDEFGDLISGKVNDNIDMRVWRDKTGQIVSSGLI